MIFWKQLVVLLCVSIFMKEESGTIKVAGLVPTRSVYIANALAGPYSALKWCWTMWSDNSWSLKLCVYSALLSEIRWQRLSPGLNDSMIPFWKVVLLKYLLFIFVNYTTRICHLLKAWDGTRNYCLILWSPPNDPGLCLLYPKTIQLPWSEGRVSTKPGVSDLFILSI